MATSSPKLAFDTTHDVTPSEGNAAMNSKNIFAGAYDPRINAVISCLLHEYCKDRISTIVRFHITNWTSDSLQLTLMSMTFATDNISWVQVGKRGKTYSRDGEIRWIRMGFTCGCKVGKTKKPHNLLLKKYMHEMRYGPKGELEWQKISRCPQRWEN